MSKVNEVLLRHGKITQEQYDTAAAKEAGKQAARDEYKKLDHAKATKADYKKLLDALTEV